MTIKTERDSIFGFVTSSIRFLNDMMNFDFCPFILSDKQQQRAACTNKSSATFCENGINYTSKGFNIL
jgi:hypothetical protein